MMRSAHRFGAAAFALVAMGGFGASVAQDGDAPPIREIARADLPGRVVFEQQCAPCHGTGPGDDGALMLPGTQALATKYAGAKPGALELRDDLPAPVLNLFVRRGVGAMSAFRKSELSDAQIEQIAAYLTATARLNQQND